MTSELLKKANEAAEALENAEILLNDIQVDGGVFIKTRNHTIRINKKESLYQGVLDYFETVKEALEKEFESLGEQDSIWERKELTGYTEYWITYDNQAAAVLRHIKKDDSNHYFFSIPLRAPTYQKTIIAESLEEAKEKALTIFKKYLEPEIQRLCGIKEKIVNA